MPELVGHFSSEDVRVGIVVARWNALVTERLEHGAIDALRRHGVDDERIVLARVPGAFEIGSIARAMLAHDRVDGVIGIGCVIRGETAHYDYICDAAIGSLAALARETGRPVTCGVLTTENLDQALQRAGGKLGNKGFEAAQALLECLDLTNKIAAS